MFFHLFMSIKLWMGQDVKTELLIRYLLQQKWMVTVDFRSIQMLWVVLKIQPSLLRNASSHNEKGDASSGFRKAKTVSVAVVLMKLQFFSTSVLN